MGKRSESQLEKLKLGQQGWNEVLSANAEKLNGILLKVDGLLDVDINGLATGDVLWWNQANQKFENVNKAYAVSAGSVSSWSSESSNSSVTSASSESSDSSESSLSSESSSSSYSSEESPSSESSESSDSSESSLSCFAGLEDDFTGTNGDDADWQRWVLNHLGGTNYLSIQSNKLNYSSPGDDNNHRTHIRHRNGIEGECSVEISFSGVTLGAPSDNRSYAVSFRLYTSGGTYIALIGRLRDQVTGYNGYITDGSDTSEVLISRTDASGKLKFVRNASDEIYAFYWTGSQWEWDGNTSGHLCTTNSSDLYIDLYFEQENNGTVDCDVDDLIVNSADGYVCVDSQSSSSSSESSESL